MPIRRSRHWPRSTPISISTKLIQLACLGIEHAACFASWKSLVGRIGRVGRQVVEDDPDHLGFRIVHVSEVTRPPRSPIAAPPAIASPRFWLAQPLAANSVIVTAPRLIALAIPDPAR